MFQMPSFCPTPYSGWEYPILDLGTNQAFNDFNLDSVFLDFSLSHQPKDYQYQEYDDHVKRSESPLGTSSTDPFDNNNNINDNNPLLSKKLNHNASERVRRKKISTLYSSLRDLLPDTDRKKKLSIPGTVVRAVEYIPELQKEVENLIRKKEELLSKISLLQGNAGEFIQEEKPKKNKNNKETTSYSVSANKLGDKEIVLQISAFERISLSEVILLLEKNGHVVMDISCFQSFGGRTFHNIHLWMEGSYIVNLENLNEALLSLLQVQEQEQKQMQMQMQMPMHY